MIAALLIIDKQNKLSYCEIAKLFKVKLNMISKNDY